MEDTSLVAHTQARLGTTGQAYTHVELQLANAETMAESLAGKPKLEVPPPTIYVYNIYTYMKRI